MLALFRILEATEGRIEIDGVDISKIGLRNCKLKPLGPVLVADAELLVRAQCEPLFPLCHSHRTCSRAP